MSTDRTAPPDSAFLESELRAARQHIDVLTRETELLRRAVGSQQQLSEELRTALVTLEGRTRRHEQGQDHTAELRHEVAQLRAQVESEAGIRRDRGASADEERDRERDLAAHLDQMVATLRDRLDAIEQRQHGEDDRRRHVAADLATQERDRRMLGSGLDEAEREIAALRSQRITDADERSRLAANIPALAEQVAALRSQVDVFGQVQHRLDDEVAALRTLRDREGELSEAIKQTRAARHRFDERLAGYERQLTTVEGQLRDAAEDRILTRQQSAASEQRVREFAATIEDQRWALLEHLRRLAKASDEQARREIDEIQRRNQVGRELLTRFTEASDEQTEEQPL